MTSAARTHASSPGASQKRCGPHFLQICNKQRLFLILAHKESCRIHVTASCYCPMSTSEDEYDAQVGGAIGELSAEDCAKIDALCVGMSVVVPSNTRCEPPTHLDVELETPQTSTWKEMTAIRLPVTTPFQRYRPRGRLSVTDLVAPAWQV
jgi:hypothetical protein